MIQNFCKQIARKIVRGNRLFHRIVNFHQHSAHPVKAVVFMLYAWPVKNLIRLDTPREIINSENYYHELHKLLRIEKVEDFELSRVGRNYDGGYIMLNDFHDGGIAYSFGISDDVSWDKDMVSRGYDVFMYDHTIDGLPEENSRFHWFKLGIADGIIQDDSLKTLEELIAQNHHENEHGMILKMDVEGAEWGFLSSVSPEILKQFDQINIEFHGLITNNNPEQVLAALRKINTTHQLIHIHASTNEIVNYYISVGGKKFCNLLETSYVLRSKYNFTENYDVNLPLSIDAPNDPNIKEIELGHWNRELDRYDIASINIMDL